MHNLTQPQSPLPRCTIWHNHRPAHLTGVIFKGLILWKCVFNVCVKLYLRWSLCTLHLHACQVRGTVGNSALCCRTCVTSFDANQLPWVFDVCAGTGFVDWLEKRYTCEKFWNVKLLMTELDCPEVTLCGWQDVKIQLLINLPVCVFFIVLI